MNQRSYVRFIAVIWFRLEPGDGGNAVCIYIISHTLVGWVLSFPLYRLVNWGTEKQAFPVSWDKEGGDMAKCTLSVLNKILSLVFWDARLFPCPIPTPGGGPCDESSLRTSECVNSRLRSHSWRLLRLHWPGRNCWFSPHAPSLLWLSSIVTCNFWFKLSRQVRNVRERLSLEWLWWHSPPFLCPTNGKKYCFVWVLQPFPVHPLLNAASFPSVPVPFQLLWQNTGQTNKGDKRASWAYRRQSITEGHQGRN